MIGQLSHSIGRVIECTIDNAGDRLGPPRAVVRARRRRRAGGLVVRVDQGLHAPARVVARAERIRRRRAGDGAGVRDLPPGGVVVDGRAAPRVGGRREATDVEIAGAIFVVGPRRGAGRGAAPLAGHRRHPIDRIERERADLSLGVGLRGQVAGGIVLVAPGPEIGILASRDALERIGRVNPLVLRGVEDLHQAVAQIVRVLRGDHVPPAVRAVHDQVSVRVEVVELLVAELVGVCRAVTGRACRRHRARRHAVKHPRAVAVRELGREPPIERIIDERSPNR